MKYERKEHNTDHWQTVINRQIDRGNDFLQMAKNTPITSFDDLIRRKNEAERWMVDTADRVQSLYKDRSVGQEFKESLANLILEKITRQQAIEILNEVVAERVERLKTIAGHTTTSGR